MPHIESLRGGHLTPLALQGLKKSSIYTIVIWIKFGLANVDTFFLYSGGIQFLMRHLGGIRFLMQHLGVCEIWYWKSDEEFDELYILKDKNWLVEFMLFLFTKSCFRRFWSIHTIKGPFQWVKWKLLFFATLCTG